MRTVFLLGAGFTYDISHKQFPLLNEVNQKISSLLDSDIAEKYRFGKDDFEICLTRLDTDSRYTFANKDVLNKESLESLELKRRLRNNKEKIRYFLADLFSMKGKAPEFNAKAPFFRDSILKNGDIILTTNYDCCLENLLGPEKFSPHGGYGRRLKWRFTREENSKLKNIKIFKLHGSVAFVIVPSGEAGKGDIEVGLTKKEFPNFNSELGWLNEEGPYLILPSFIKPIEFSAIAELYQEAIDEMVEADRLVIIGSSLREEDHILWLILSGFKKHKYFKIIIVDPRASNIKEELVNTLHFFEENITVLDGTLTERIDDLRKFLDTPFVPPLGS